jgi:hypothetical protein
MSPKLELAAEPVQRGKLLWTWEAIISRGFVLGRFPTRMCIAGYPLAEGQIGLVVIGPLNPTEAVVQWLQKTGQVCHCAAAAAAVAAAATGARTVIRAISTATFSNAWSMPHYHSNLHCAELLLVSRLNVSSARR